MARRNNKNGNGANGRAGPGAGRRLLPPDQRQEPVIVRHATVRDVDADTPNPETINLPRTARPTSAERAPAKRRTATAASHRPAVPAADSGNAEKAGHRRRRRPSPTVLGRLTHGLAALFALGSIGLAVVAFAILILVPGKLPDHRTLLDYQPDLRSVVYDRNGAKVGEFAPTNRIYMALEKIPKRVVEAFLAAEDHRFFEHDGIDLRAVLRAALANVGLYGGSTGLQGGSTITQQVVKNLLLSNARTVERKLKELILSWRIERSLPKRKILEIYLNEIFMGRTAYGVAAAAREYFGKTLDKLTVAETAFLAGLPQAPSRYNPESRPKVAVARRNHVLERMHATGLIDDEQLRFARAEPIKVAPGKPTTVSGAAWFVEEVRRDMRERFGDKGMAHGGFAVKTTLNQRYQRLARAALRKGLLAFDRRHGWRGPVTNIAGATAWRDTWQKALAAVEPPRGHGDWPLAVVLSVGRREALIAFANGKAGAIPLAELTWARRQVTINRPGRPVLKTAGGRRIARPGDVLKEGDVVLVEAVKKDARGKPYPPNTFTLRQIPEINGALVALDPHTGKVFALSGGFSFWKSQFNAATQAWRQPGSSFKPFVYLAALEAGLTPVTIIRDDPLSVRIERGKVWSPKNYDGKFRGPMTMRTALALSRNVVAVRLAQHAGLATVARIAGQFGLSDKKLTPVPSTALGAQETTLLRMVAAYGMLANGGKRIEPTLIDRVTDRSGRSVYVHTVARCPDCGVYGPRAKRAESAGETVKPIADPRSIFQLISMMRDVVERGTGSALRAAGVPVAGKTGTTNEHLDAWFVGFTQGMVVGVWVGYDRAQSMGRREQGGFTAAPIARAFLKAVYKDRKVADFTPPRGVRRMAVKVEAGEDEDGFPVFRRVVDYFKTDPQTGRALIGDLSITGDEDADGHTTRDGDAEKPSVVRGRRRIRQRRYDHYGSRGPQEDRDGYARPEAFDRYGR